MSTIECRSCKRAIVPQVTRSESGMISRACPFCGADQDGLLNSDVSTIRIKTLYGIIVLLAIATPIGLLLFNATSK